MPCSTNFIFWFLESECSSCSPSLRNGSVFVALRPDNTTVDVRLLASALIEEVDKVGAEGWTKTKHTQRIIPVERIAPETSLEELAKKIVEEHFPAIAAADRPETLSTFR